MTGKPDYLDDLVLELRLLDVPGERIGQILAEHESHLAESGETPEAAFGPVRTYARELAEREGKTLPAAASSSSVLRQFYVSMGPSDWLMAIVGFIVTAGGTFLIISGIWAAAGDDPAAFGLPPLLAIVLGAAPLAGWFWWARTLSDPIIDPRTGDEVRFGLRGHREN